MFSNAITIAIDSDTIASVSPNMLQGFAIFDQIAIIIFFLEILLKWLDSFVEYWDDPWNVFDFVVTILVRIVFDCVLAVHFFHKSFSIGFSSLVAVHLFFVSRTCCCKHTDSGRPLYPAY